MVVAPGKSSRFKPVPCHVSVHPPDCFMKLSAPSPAINRRCPAFSGSVPPSFFSKTSDSRTAWRATARLSGEPSLSSCPASGREDGLTISNTPARSLTRRIRATASSSRAIGSAPDFAETSVASYSPFQLSGAMYMSRPAITEAGQSVFLHPGICPCPFQSPTTKPPKPMRPLRTSVSRDLLPCILTPCQLE